MYESRVASRYAKSLLELAKERDALEEVADDMMSFYKVAEENRNFRIFLASPVIYGSKKLNVIDEIFKTDNHIVSHLFLTLLVKKKRETYLVDVAKEFLNMYREMRGINQVTLTTAVPMDDHIRGRVTWILENRLQKKVELIEKVNPDILGGYIVNSGDRELNRSIAFQLKKLKQSFIDTSYIPQL
jgi:F-type H+-transporting ATPase subunit delta